MADSSRGRRRGYNLIELAFALLIVGVVLGAVWKSAGKIYQNVDAQKATKELTTLVQSIRTAHETTPVVENEQLDSTNLSADLIHNFKGQKIIFNPWSGVVSVFPGNAMGWGGDNYTGEFTLRLTGIPRSACPALVQNVSQGMRNLGLVGVYISPSPGEGKEICFALDAFCKTTVTAASEPYVEHLCEEKPTMTVMFSFATGN